ncbi:MAG: hypothetical protein KIT16_17025 [Rhodospirillaceae bacterium]|nr:hypothetical protein [Rhodospirillaceae bacterium]
MRRRDYLAGSLAAFGFTAVGGFTARRAAAQGKAVTIAFPFDVPSWDPVVSETPTTSSISRCVFDKPLELAPDLSYAPSVVTSRKWIGTDGMALEVTLRDDVYFHNGDKLTSEDFKFTFFDRVKANKPSLLRGVWNRITAIETPSPTRAIMRFREPMVTAPVMMADIPAYILPKAYYEKMGVEGFVKKPVGSGPYKLVEYERNARIVLEANEKHWRGAPKIKRVVFQILRDPIARIGAVQTGQADIAINLPVREVERIGAMPNMKGHIGSITSVTLIQFTNIGVCTDKNVRLACHHAIDKQALSKAIFQGHAVPIYTPAGPGMPAYDPDFKIEPNIAKAKALLAASGYGPGKPVTFKFYTTNGTFPGDFDIARAIVQMWKRAGIEAELKVLEAAQMYDFQRNRKFDGPVLKPFNPAAGDPATYSGFMLDPRQAFAIWRSDDIPAKLYPLLTEVDDAKRLAGFKEFDRWQVSQGYTIPLFLGLATVVHAKALNFKPYASGFLAPYSWSWATERG